MKFKHFKRVIECIEPFVLPRLKFLQRVEGKLVISSNRTVCELSPDSFSLDVLKSSNVPITDAPEFTTNYQLEEFDAISDLASSVLNNVKENKDEK